jgi:hypothetical protein
MLIPILLISLLAYGCVVAVVVACCVAAARGDRMQVVDDREFATYEPFRLARAAA